MFLCWFISYFGIIKLFGAVSKSWEVTKTVVRILASIWNMPAGRGVGMDKALK
jgi:hypothetical protein